MSTRSAGPTVRTSLTVARHELRMVVRERLILVVLAVFLAMTVLAGYIGFSSASVVDKAYALALPYIQRGGAPRANPFDAVSHLSLQRNLSIYYFLIGSLLAIIIGHVAGVRDRTARTSGLLLSRPISRTAYAGAKVLTVLAALALVLALSFGVTLAASALLPGLSLSLDQAGRLALFFALSWVYLGVFGLLGLAAGIAARTEISALLLPVVAWIVVGFVLPQASSAIEPTATLNPVTVSAPVSSPNQYFVIMGQLTSPLSIADAYKRTANDLLEFASQAPVVQVLAENTAHLVAVVGALLIAVALAAVSIRRYSPTEDGIS